MLVLWIEAMLEVRSEAPERVAALAEEVGHIVHESMLTHGEGPALWLKGWAAARRGSPTEAFKLIREGFDRHARLGMFAGNTEVLGYGVEALVLAREWTQAREQLTEAFNLAQRIDEQVTLVSLHLLDARIAQGQGQNEAARAALEAAWATARTQQSLFYEVKTLLALSELNDRSAREYAPALQYALDRLPEGQDLPYAIRARDALRHSIPTET
jgi:ATP/maltotriose-dependent transcriptional regulator MalT